MILSLYNQKFCNNLIIKSIVLHRIFVRAMHNARHKVAPEVVQSLQNAKVVVLPQITTPVPYNTHAASQNTDKMITNAAEISKIRESADLAAQKNLFVKQWRAKGSLIETIVDCLEKHMPLEELVLQAQLHEVSNGDNIKLVEQLATKTNVFPKGCVFNAQRIIKKAEWDQVPVPFQTQLTNLSLKKQGMLLYEILAAFQINRDLIHNRMGFAFHVEIINDGVNITYTNTYRYERDLSDWPNYHNQTPNKHPDKVLVLNVPVIVDDKPKDLIAYDLKFGQLQLSRNITKACTTETQFVQELELAQQCLIDYIKKQKEILSSSDKRIADALTRDLEHNLYNFKETNDSVQFRATYHGFHEKYASFLIRNRIGFNFLAKFSIDDFAIQIASKSQFSETFQKYFNSEKGLTSAFAQKIASENGTSNDLGKYIIEFATEVLKKKNNQLFIMTFPIYFYIALAVISPWPIVYSIIFFYVYIYDTTFEYYITKKAQLRRLWAYVLVLPIFCSYILFLRYNRIGISIDIFAIIKTFSALIEPLGWLDIFLLFIILLVFLVPWLLALRCLYQYFRKCVLALYLYYYKYKKITHYYHKMVSIEIYYDSYIWNRVRIFFDTDLAYAITWIIWPFSRDIIERNLYSFILPYLLFYDILIENGVITKIFIVLPWFYVYSIIRMSLKYFHSIHKFKNWESAIKMYGYPK